MKSKNHQNWFIINKLENEKKVHFWIFPFSEILEKKLIFL